MFHFYINAPSITDWLQVLFSLLSVVITGLGTWYVAQTFNKQNTINIKQDKLMAQQVKLNTIAMRRNQQEILPIIGLEPYDDEFPERIVFKLLNAMAISGKIEDMTKEPPMVVTTFAAALPESFRYHIDITQEKRLQYKGKMLLKFTFQDTDGRTYVQALKSYDASVKMTFPGIEGNDTVSPFNFFEVPNNVD